MLAALLLAFLFCAGMGSCLPGARAEETEGKAETAGTGEEPLRGNGFPYLNEAGFLAEGEYIEENPEEGVWRYAGTDLRIEILRQQTEKPKLTWYEAEIWCAEGSAGPRMILADQDAWPRVTEFPYKLARKTGTVLGVSGDFAHLRAQQKARTGVIIRGGQVLSERTWKANSSHFPNLDCLALYADGDMRVFDSDEKTAEELLAEGAVDVLSFGPWLIRDGALNETALKKYGKSSAQRVAVGMAEKGHYFFMMLEGRIARSRGAGISFLAERMLEKGCTVAFNLDGGQTASIVFMGHQLCKMDNKNRNLSSRRAADILGVGHSDRVAGTEDPW